MTREHRQLIIRWATLILTVAAFAGSYRHGVTWAMAHTKHPAGETRPDGWMLLTAFMPEVMVGLSVLKAQDNYRDPVAWIIGTSAVAWTLWANGSSAGSGTSGLVVALWPAWAALSALWLMGHGSGTPVVPAVAQPEPRPKMTRDKRPKPAESSDPFKPVNDLGHPVLVAADLDPAGDPSGQSKETAHARGVRWVMAQDVVPSVGQIQTYLESSRKTASRVSVAARAARAATEENR